MWRTIRPASIVFPWTWVIRPAPDRPTDERIRTFATDHDPSLVALYCQFGRYLLTLLLAAGRSAGQLARHLEQQPESPLGLQVHGQHQHRDELLARRTRQPAGVLRAAVRHDRRSVADRRENGPGAVRRGRMGLPSQHGRLARDRAGGLQRSGMWPTGGAWLCKSFWDHYEFTGDKKALAAHYPHDARGGAVLPGHAGGGADAPLARDLPLGLAGELAPSGREHLRRADDGYADFARPV